MAHRPRLLLVLCAVLALVCSAVAQTVAPDSSSQQNDWEQQEDLLDEMTASQVAAMPPPVMAQLSQEQGELDLLEQKQNSIAYGVASRVPVTPMKVGGKTQQKKAPAKRAPSVGGDDGLKDLEAKGAMTGGVAEPYRAAAKKTPRRASSSTA